MLNTLHMSFSENLAVLVVLLFMTVWFQSRWHRGLAGLRMGGKLGPLRSRKPQPARKSG